MNKSNISLFAFFTYMILGSLFVYSAGAELISATVLTITPGLMLLICVLINMALYFIFYNKYTAGAFFAFLLILALIIVLGHYLGAREKTSYLTALIGYFEEIISFVRGAARFSEAFNAPVTVAVMVALGLIFVAFYKGIYNFIALFLAGATVFFINIALGYHNNDAALLIFLLFCMISLLQGCNFLSNRSLHKNVHSTSFFTLCAMPLCVLALCLGVIMPRPGGGIDAKAVYEFFQNPLSAMDDALYLAFNQRYFSFQSTGYSGGDSLLGGNVALNNSLVMNVKAGHRLYLAGDIKSEYTGSRWLAESDEFADYFEENELARRPMSGGNSEDYYTVEAFERQLILDLKRIDYNYDGGSFFVKVLETPISREPGAAAEITFEGRKTGSLFFPPEFIRLEPLNRDVLYNGFALRTEKLFDRGESYGFSYYYVDPEDEALKSYLRGLGDGAGYAAAKGWLEWQARQIMGDTGSFTAALNYGDAASGKVGPAYLFDSGILDFYAARAGEIRRKYTRLPEELPARVYDLAREITKGLDNDYDKAAAISAYLSIFDYTLSPGDTPANRDFVDYFLFERQEGYCSHFATAFAVLCRCVGIPVRYVEGYALPAEPDSDDVYKVTDNNAHAWPEVYFEGFGWLRFEPTAGGPAAEAAPAPGDEPVSSERPPAPGNDNSGLDDEWVRPRPEHGGRDPEDQPGGESAEAETAAEAERSLGMRSALYFGGAALVFILLAGGGLFALFMRKYLKLAGIKKLSHREAVIKYFKIMMFISGKIGPPRKPFETALTYDSGHTIGNRPYAELAEIFSRARYSGIDISYEERAFFEIAVEKYMARYKFFDGTFRYIYNMYFVFEV